MMKGMLKSLAHRLGYSITRLDSRVEIDCAWGPNILIYALEDLAGRSSEPLRIVQIGAHDGSDQDPLQPFLVSHDCEAILIEPMDHPYATLAERYSGRGRIHAVQAAVSDAPGLMEMHYITDRDGRPDLTLFSSFDYDTVKRNLETKKKSAPEFGDHQIRNKSIEARTVRQLLEQFGMADVDAVIVDAEGFDHRIVAGFLNDGVEPKIIRFEYCNLTRRDFEALRRLLIRKDYEIVRVGIDIYCQKTGLLR